MPKGSKAQSAKADSLPPAAILDVLKAHGVLLKQHKTLPNVVTLVTGESLSASWWGHPRGREIFAVLSALEDHPDVLFTKLLSGAVTLVHRRLWPAFAAAASAREAWQLDGLSATARDLLDSVERLGVLRSSGKPVKELEKRLLVNAHQVHTKSGRHETEVESWPVWSSRTGVEPGMTSAQGRKILEKAVQALGAPLSALPWN